jgi:hypothetical protein
LHENPLFTRTPRRGASHVRQATHLLTYCNDRADSLVPWHEWVRRNSHFVSDQVQIRVTHAAMCHR